MSSYSAQSAAHRVEVPQPHVAAHIRPAARFAVLLAAMLAASSASAARPAVTSLGELFVIAHEGEPNYHAAKANVAASRARTRQAFGGMLPQLTASLDSNRNRRRYVTTGPFGATSRDRYDGGGNQLRLTQPLWRPADRAGWRQAQASERQAEFQLVDAEQQLYLKLATTWFELMEARDKVEFTTAQRDSLQAKWSIAKRAMAHGLESPPRVSEAHAEYERANADQASAELDAATKLAALEQWIGPADGLTQPYLREDAEIPELVGTDLDAWLEQVDRSPALRAARRALVAASEEVSKQRAGHQPTLDMVASYGDTEQDVGETPAQSGYRNRQWAVGLQLNVPLYSGGTQSAKVTEARALQDKARDDLEAARRQALVDVKTAFLGWRAGRAKAAAVEFAKSSAELVLLEAERGVSHGLKVDADVLAARQQVAAVRGDARKAAYQQLVSYIRLKAALGQLSAEDILDLDQLFSARDDGAVMAGKRES